MPLDLYGKQFLVKAVKIGQFVRSSQALGFYQLGKNHYMGSIIYIY